MATTKLPYAPPTEAYDPNALFPQWDTVFPFLSEIAAHWQEIRDEIARVGPTWKDWPEFSLYHPEKGEEWRVVPFLYTIPADDDANMRWVDATVQQCPRTAELLKRIPGLRTALFSKMGPMTSLTPHQGWAALSNHVLRCHLPLVIPRAEGAAAAEAGAPVEGPPVSGLIVEDVICPHREGQLLIFDDSRVHSAFNNHPSQARVVLIFDVARPAQALPGFATGGTTAELHSFMDYFK